MQLASSSNTATNADWRILGQNTLVLTLTSGERAVCEPGAMVAHQEGIEATITAGTGVWDAAARCMFGGEQMLQDCYANASNAKKELTLAAPFPNGQIVSVMMDQYSSMVIAPGAWMATKGTDIHFDVRLVKDVYAGMFAGRGFALPTISGSAQTFLCGGGSILSCVLGSRESMVIDETSFLACESSVNIKAVTSGSVWMMACGGEGMFQCKLTGPGRVLLQSMPVGHMAKGIDVAAKKAKGIWAK